jgi:DHA1 family tetracycline resistance protein-like MFS transporter
VSLLRKLLPILGITFVDILGFSMLIPVLPYYVTHFGAAPVVVGLISSVFSLCQLASGPMWGHVSDRVGRKAVLIVSQIGATIGWMMLAFAPTIAWVFIARIVEGVSGGNIGITQAYVADVAEAKDRARAFGYIGATFGLGMVFGPFIAGMLFARFGYSAPFVAASLLQLLTLGLTIFFLPESRTKKEDERHLTLRDTFATLRSGALRPILVQKLALSMSLYGWYLAIALYLKYQLGFSLVETTVYYSAFALFNVLVNAVFVGRASKLRGDRTMSNIGLASLAAGFALVPFVHSTWLLVVSMLLFGYGSALASTGITALLSAAASERDQGTVLSVGSSLDSLAGIASPPISTGMLGRYGSAFAGVDSLVFACLALGLGLGASLKKKTA